MSDILISARSGGTARRAAAGGEAGRQANLNQKMSWALIVLLALVPLPFGSVHGFSWGAFATLTGLLATVYALALHQMGGTWRYPLTALKVPARLFGLLLAFMVVQVLPLGALLGPFTIATGAAATLTSDTISVATDLTFLTLMRQLTYGIFFFLVLQVSLNDNRRRFVFDAILIIVLAYGIMAIISLQTGDTVLGLTKKAYAGSATGPFVNRNSFATFTGFGSIIALAQIGRRIVDQLERHPNDGKIPGNISAIALYAIAYVILIAVVVATQSRMGLAATATGSLVVASIILTRSVQSRRTLFGVVALGVLAIVSALALFGEGLFDRMFDLDRASETRSALYAQVLELIEKRPLFGFGGGTFELAFPLVHHAPVSADFLWDKAHNTYLTLWSEFGLIFGSIPMLLGLLVAGRLVKSLRTRGPNWMAQTIALGCLTLAGMHSLVDFSLEIQANALLFVAIIAAGVSAAHRSKR
ncbi:MAG: O-antigen ligase family protein [Cypionkella sp.]